MFMNIIFIAGTKFGQKKLVSFFVFTEQSYRLLRWK